MNEQSKKLEQPPLDELTGAFTLAAHRVTNAVLKRQKLKNRYMLLSSASSVIHGLLNSIQFPRDQRLIARLATLNLQITGFLDNIVANADASDQGLQALCKLAEREPAWPALVRPSDPKFTKLKLEGLERLNVGRKC